MNLRRLLSTRALAVTSTLAVAIGGLVPSAAAVDPPPNDSFLSPTQVLALPFTETLDISGATEEPNDSAPVCTASKTVWYEFAAPSARPISIDTFGTTFPTNITIYAGTVPVPVSVSCSSASRVFYPTAGQKYRVRIGTDDPDTAGLLTLNISNLGSVSGRVVDAGGEPVSDIEVYIQTTGSPWEADWTYTDLEGRYSFPDLPKGSYKVEFWDPNGQYMTSWYHNVPTYSQAQVIQVASDAIALDDQVIALGGSIEGTLTGSDGSQPDACIYAYDSNGWVRRVGYVEAGDPRFSITGLPASTYRLEVHESCSSIPFGIFQTEWYENAVDDASATPIVIAESQAIDGIEIVVDPAPVPANDERANATQLETLPAQLAQGLTRATASPSDPKDCGIVGGTTWFSYVPAEDEYIFITNYSYNARIAVQAEAADGSLSLVGCSSTSYWSPERVELEEGTRYLLEVGATKTGAPSGVRATIFDSDGGGKVTFTPSNPCHVQCPYWNQNRTREEKHEDPCAPTPESPEGSWQDHKVTVPSTVNGKIPYALGFTMDPAVDHDVWFCSVEPNAQGKYTVTYAANLITTQCDLGLPVGCAESFHGSVQPDKEYIIRVYNWSDPSPVDGAYWFLGTKPKQGTATATPA